MPACLLRTFLGNRKSLSRLLGQCCHGCFSLETVGSAAGSPAVKFNGGHCLTEKVSAEAQPPAGLNVRLEKSGTVKLSEIPPSLKYQSGVPYLRKGK